VSYKTFEISIPADEDGYVKFQCPYCNQKFKLNASEIEESDVVDLYCPVCGLANEVSNFYSDEVMEKAMSIAENEAMNMIFDMFKDFERSTRSNKNFNVKAGKKPDVPIKEIYENIDELIEVKLNCCDKHIKVSELDRLLGVYCSYCGVKDYEE
jgi:uncharacterized Zn-finger protein